MTPTKANGLHGEQSEHDDFKHHADGGGLHLPTDVVPKVVANVKRADDKLVAFVRERPVVALGAAVVAGYVIGRIFTRF